MPVLTGGRKSLKNKTPTELTVVYEAKELLDTGSALFIGDVKPQWLQGALFAWRHVTVMDAMYVLFTEANGNGWTQGFVIRSRKKKKSKPGYKRIGRIFPARRWPVS